MEYARTLGADDVIDAGTARFEELMQPVDVVIDTVGGDVQARSFSVLKRGGCLVSSAATPDAERAAESGVSASFILVNVTSAALRQIAELADAGKLQTRIGPVLPLAEARNAHEMLDGIVPRLPGKILLSVSGSDR